MKIEGKKIKYLYMAVTKDKYELPIAVADSVSELAEMVHVKPTTISFYLATGRPGFVKVDVSDED